MRTVPLCLTACWLAFLATSPAASLPGSEGGLDTGFAGDGVVTIPFDIGAYKSDLGTSIVALANGGLVVAGSVTLTDTGAPRAMAAAQLTASGAADTTFGGGDGRVDYTWGLSTWVLVAAIGLPEGEVVLAGTIQWSLTDMDFLIVRLLPDGSLDPRFGGGDGWTSVPFDVNPGGSIFDIASSLYATPSGDLLVAGTVKRAGDDWDIGVARLTPGGSLDMSFGDGTGKVVVAIDAGGYAGQDQALAVFPSGEGGIVIVGGCENGGTTNTDFAIVLLDQGGHLIPSFGTGGKMVLPFDLVPSGLDYAFGGAADGYGRIYAVGRAELSGGDLQSAVACVTTAGEPCAGFGVAGKTHFPLAASPSGDEQLNAAVVDDLGRLVAAGTARVANRDAAIVRLLPSGALDPSFAVAGVRIVDLDHGPGGDADEAYGLALSAGMPVVVGTTEYVGVDEDFFALRLFVALIHADGFERGTFEAWQALP